MWAPYSGASTRFVVWEFPAGLRWMGAGGDGPVGRAHSTPPRVEAVAGLERKEDRRAELEAVLARTMQSALRTLKRAYLG